MQEENKETKEEMKELMDWLARNPEYQQHQEVLDAEMRADFDKRIKYGKTI